MGLGGRVGGITPPYLVKSSSLKTSMCMDVLNMWGESAFLKEAELQLSVKIKLTAEPFYRKMFSDQFAGTEFKLS